MGWKIAIATTPLGGCTLLEKIEEIYQKTMQLADSGKTVEEVVSLQDGPSFATEANGCAWVFDWQLITKTLDSPSPPKLDLDVFFLHSVVNGYGFARLRRGHVLRCRIGDSDNGIHTDSGEILPFETAAVVETVGQSRLEDGLAVWQDENVSMESDSVEWFHADFGEEIVFAAMADSTGIRLDRYSNESEGFLKQYVQITRRSGFNLARMLGMLQQTDS